MLRAALAEHGTNRDGTGPAEFPVAKRVYIAVDEDAGRARERMAAALIDVYGAAFGSGLLPVTVLGAPDACVRGLREVADAGAGMILLTALFDQHADGAPRRRSRAAPVLIAVWALFAPNGDRTTIMRNAQDPSGESRNRPQPTIWWCTIGRARRQDLAVTINGAGHLPRYVSAQIAPAG